MALKINKQIDFNVTTLVILVLLALAVIQGIGLIFGQLNIFLGPVFVLLAIALGAAVSLALVKKIRYNQFIGREDMVAFLLVFIVAVLIVIFLRDLVPEVFSQSLIQIQSALGF